MSNHNFFAGATLPRPLNSYNERQLRWLWRQLQAFGATLPHESTVPAAQRTVSMANVFASSQNPGGLIQGILDQEKNLLIPDECFKWIEKNDDRLLIWLLLQAQNYNLTQAQQFQIPIPPIWTIPSEARKNEFVLGIDCCNCMANSKQQFLNDLKMRWGQVTAEDKQRKFLDPTDQDQLTWAWDYLNKDFKAQAYLKPINTKELYIAVMSSIDNMAVQHPAEKKLFIEKMKKTWSQKKYRGSEKAKKMRSFPMLDDVSQMLDECATSHGKKPFEVLETLIRREHQIIASNRR